MGIWNLQIPLLQSISLLKKLLKIGHFCTDDLYASYHQRKDRPATSPVFKQKIQCEYIYFQFVVASLVLDAGNSNLKNAL